MGGEWELGRGVARIAASGRIRPLLATAAAAGWWQGAPQLLGSAPPAKPRELVMPGLGCQGGREQPGAAWSLSGAEEPDGPELRSWPVRLRVAARDGSALLVSPRANLFYIKQMTKATSFSTCSIQVEKKLYNPHCNPPAVRRVRCKLQQPSDGQLFHPSKFPTSDCVAEPSNQNLSLRVSLLPTFSLHHIFQLASGTTWVWF